MDSDSINVETDQTHQQGTLETNDELPTMADLDRLNQELDQVDANLAALDNDATNTQADSGASTGTATGNDGQRVANGA